jgi:hypothetical protein
VRRSVRVGAGVLILLAAAAALVATGVVPMGRGPAAAAPSGHRPALRSAPTQLLEQLDSLREKAFAEGRAELLSRVYTSPALLAQDATQLRTRVPAGCQLAGLKTSYREVTVISQTVSRIELRAVVALAPAEVRCGGQGQGRTASAGPTPIRIVLAIRPDGSFGVDSQQTGG